jgi:CheY-like chemotaxis protein
MVEVTRARVLVVEDDPEAALFLVHVLANRCRFEVVHTADPATALQLAATSTGTWCSPTWTCPA